MNGRFEIAHNYLRLCFILVMEENSQVKFSFDKRRVRAQFARAVSTYDDAAVLQRTVGDRLIERLDTVRLEPKDALDLGCGTGYGTRKLARRYRAARVIGVDLSGEMARRARRAAGWFHP